MFVIGIHNKLLCDQNFSQCHVWKPTCMQRTVQSSSDKIIYPVVSHLQLQFKNELFHNYILHITSYSVGHTVGVSVLTIKKYNEE